MKLSEAIGLRVSELLKERQIFQFYLFKNGGVPRSTVCDVINHKKKRVSTETIYQICSTLNISLSKFFDSPFFNDLDD